MTADDLDIAREITADPKVRRAVARESFPWFFNLYFPHYVKYLTADFQHEMFSLLEDEKHQSLVFVAFRGSGKSTIVTMAYVLWAILGKQQKKYVVICGLTQRQARQHLQNIKRELENNEILRNDLGPFREEQDEWGSLSLVISNCGAKITAASTEQSIRGMRHGAHRPDLIILDDVEDLASVQTFESRDKTYQWFSGDVFPAGDIGTRMIVVGNLLHEDSLIMRLKNGISNGDFTGTFRQYPIMDESGICLWPGKFPDEQSLEVEKKKIGNYNAWMREYMLCIIPEDDQVVLPEWIKKYEKLPDDTDGGFRFTLAAADLAISQRQTADYTAIVIAKVYGWGKDMRIYILPYPINARLNFPQQLDTVKQIIKEYDGRIEILIESNGYQKALVEKLEEERYPVKGVPTYGQDKRVRLSLATPHLKSGVVLFPQSGAEHLIQQLIGFGAEKHDDLADAFTMLIDGCVRSNRRSTSDALDDLIGSNKHLAHQDPNGLYYRQF